MKRAITFVAGIAAGVSFVVACHHAGSGASAAPGDCAVWQAAMIQTPYADPANLVSYSITDTTKTPPAPYTFTFVPSDFPAGWEPVGAAGDKWIVRRCKP